MQCSVCSVQCAVFSVQCAVVSVQCAVYIVQCAVVNMAFRVRSVQNAVCGAVFSAVCSVQFPYTAVQVLGFSGSRKNCVCLVRVASDPSP